LNTATSTCLVVMVFNRKQLPATRCDIHKIQIHRCCFVVCFHFFLSIMIGSLKGVIVILASHY
jgi:hypothetical protein